MSSTNPTDEEQRCLETLKKLLPYVHEEDAKISGPGDLVRAIGERVIREENIQAVEASGSYPSMKQTYIDVYNKCRRWIPVTEAHWNHTRDCVPPAVMKHGIVLCGELWSGRFSFAVYAAPDGKYWAAQLTAGEARTGSAITALPYADDMPVFMDIQPE